MARLFYYGQGIVAERGLLCGHGRIDSGTNRAVFRQFETLGEFGIRAQHSDYKVADRDPVSATYARLMRSLNGSEFRRSGESFEHL